MPSFSDNTSSPPNDAGPAACGPYSPRWEDCFGLLLPASTTLVLAVGSDAPGAASGMLGGAQFALGAAAAPLPGVLGSTTAQSTAVVVLGFVLFSAVVLATLARPWQGHGEPAGQP
ncbi:hypothetical protein [Streptomyces nigrescens]